MFNKKFPGRLSVFAISNADGSLPNTAYISADKFKSVHHCFELALTADTLQITLPLKRTTSVDEFMKLYALLHSPESPDIRILQCNLDWNKYDRLTRTFKLADMGARLQPLMAMARVIKVPKKPIFPLPGKEKQTDTLSALEDAAAAFLHWEKGAARVGDTKNQKNVRGVYPDKISN